MKIVKTFYDVTEDQRDGFGRQRNFTGVEEYSIQEYIIRQMNKTSYNEGQLESLGTKVQCFQESFARLMEALAEKVKFTGPEIAAIVGDFIDDEGEEIKLEDD